MAQGRLQTYKIDRIPPRLVQTLADKRFARDGATKVIVGTYYLIDPRGDPARTRRLWREAAQQGIEVDDLMPELTEWAGP